jgi:hypothetical protein
MPKSKPVSAIALLMEDHEYVKAVRKAIKDDDLMNEAEVEHDSAKVLIRQLERMKPSDPRFSATFTVLGDARINLKGLGAKLMGRKIRLASST